MWYSTGTVSITNGSSTVTGSGTAFLANARIGDGIVIQGSTAMHEIIGIASDTSLTIRPGYTGTTGSGRQFAVAPMLGYDKDLSDAFNEIRLQFGDTLSALKPWAYAATAAAARNELGLGSAAVLQALGTAPLYGRDSVVGTVSQSGGVPTGALVEYGSNANGEFWRYVGGMQVCQHYITMTSSGNSSLISSAWTFPADYSGTPNVQATLGFFGNYPAPGAREGLVGVASTSNQQTTVRIYSNGAWGASDAFGIHITAIGRWHA